MINNYKALDLGRFMKIDRILRTPAEEIDKQVQIVAILADMTEAEVLQLPLADYQRMALQIGFLGAECPPEEVTGEPFQAGDWLLVPTKDFTKINTAQYVDFQTFAKDYPSTIPELLSCFLVPFGKSYNDGYDIAEVQQAVRELMLPKAIGLTAFFFNSFRKSIEGTLHSLELKTRNPETRARMAKTKRMAETALLALGGGLPI